MSRAEKLLVTFGVAALFGDCVFGIIYVWARIADPNSQADTAAWITASVVATAAVVALIAAGTIGEARERKGE